MWWLGAGIVFSVFEGAGGEDGRKLVLVVDPGHRPEAKGALSARGVWERCYNQRMAEFLAERLIHDAGVEVRFTNGWTDSVSNEARAELANRLSADLFLSIHHDSAEVEWFDYWTYNDQIQFYYDRLQGYSILISPKKETVAGSLCFARLLSRELRGLGFTPSRQKLRPSRRPLRRSLDPEFGIYAYEDIVVLHDARMPAVILECGVIVNREEEKLLLDPEAQYRMVLGMARAVRKYPELCRSEPGETAAGKPGG